MDWRDNAMEFIAELLEDDSVLPIEDILAEILALQLQNQEQLEEFLQDHEDNFLIENGRVAWRDPDLEDAREAAVFYFEDALEGYNERPYYLNFRGHIGQAEENVKQFINNFYPGKEFKNFLRAHQDVFILFNDNTVSLIETECVNYFGDCLENQEGKHFMNFRGHISQAPQYVIDYIKEYYPGENFLEFLRNNDHVFDVDEEGCVFLNQNNETE